MKSSSSSLYLKSYSKSLYIFLIFIILNIYINIANGTTYTTVFENPNPKSSKIVNPPLKCPKMKVEFCYGGISDQCKIDSDCKLYGENQKCCLRVGCGMRCVHGINV